MPNPNTLPSYRYQDIQIPDTTIRQQYKNYWTTGQYSQALSLLANNSTQLQGKAFIADVLNIIASGALNLEQKFNTGVPVFLSNLATQYSDLINNFINKGIWSYAIVYTPYNFVIYNNEIYMCIQETTAGILPTDNTYWLYLGLQGAKGDPGIDVNMRYTWNNSNTYNPNDLVVYGANIYVALAQNTNVVPSSNPSIWGIFITTTPGQIYVGTTAPMNPIQNTVWFETQVDPLAQTSSTPITGQFNRYNTSTSSWEEMYPNVLFRWLDGFDDYAPVATKINITIQSTQWQNQEFVYSYPTLTTDNFVSVYPADGMTTDQYDIFNSLSVSINGTNIVLSTSIATPIFELPIIIQIQ